MDQNKGGGVQLPNGTWTGAMGYLTGNPNFVDLAAFPLSVTSARVPFIDYTTPPYLTEGYAILKKKEESIGTFQIFLQPFASDTWFALLAAMLSIGLLMFFLDRITGIIRRRANAHHDVEEEVPRNSCHRFCFEGLVSFVGFGKEPETKSWSTRIIWLTWMVFGLVIIATYSANLTASLTVEQFQGGVNSLQQLKLNGGDLGVMANGSVNAYFENSSDDSTAGSMKKKAVKIDADKFRDATEHVRQHELAALIGDYYNMVYLSKIRPCDLAVAKEPFGPGQLAIGLPKNSPLTVPLSQAMLKLQESGFISDLRQQWLGDNAGEKWVECAADGQGGTNPLSLKRVNGIFVLLALGCAFATVYAFGEWIYLTCCYYRCNRWRKLCQDHVSSCREHACLSCCSDRCSRWRSLCQDDLSSSNLLASHSIVTVATLPNHEQHQQQGVTAPMGHTPGYPSPDYPPHQCEMSSMYPAKPPTAAGTSSISRRSCWVHS